MTAKFGTEIRGWRDDVQTWVSARRAFVGVEPSSAVAFFERAFRSVLCPNDAWFGIHGGRVSVVVGGLYLAALHAKKRDRGVWLLLDPEGTLPPVGGLEYHSAHAKHQTPNLQWGHARQATQLREIAAADAVWRALSRASRTVLATPMGTPRDDVQLARRKIRIADILSAESHASSSPQEDADPVDISSTTADPVELESRVRQLRATHTLARPVRDQVPARCTSTARTVYERSPAVKAWVLIQANGRCDLCRQPAPFHDADGEPYLEVHHVLPLAVGGADTVENAVALCPNCHRHLHHGADGAGHVERLYSQVPRLIRDDTTVRTRPNKALEPTGPHPDGPKPTMPPRG